MSPISRTEGQCRPGRIILPTLSHEEKRRDKAIVTENISSQVNETAVTAEEESVDEMSASKINNLQFTRGPRTCDICS